MAYLHSLLMVGFLCYITSSVFANIQTVNGKIKITIGTTSGCSDTVHFINQQLVSAYDIYGEYLDLEFVPWGRTRRDVDGNLICQFGPNDCWANRLHRCALHLLEGDQEAQLKYMTCEFSSPYPAFLQNSYECAESIGLSLDDISKCISIDSGDLEHAAEETSAGPMQIINFVPYITFNDVIDVNLHNQARTQLVNILCAALAEDPTAGITCPL